MPLSAPIRTPCQIQCQIQLQRQLKPCSSTPTKLPSSDLSTTVPLTTSIRSVPLTTSVRSTVPSPPSLTHSGATSMTRLSTKLNHRHPSHFPLLALLHSLPILLFSGTWYTAGGDDSRSYRRLLCASKRSWSELPQETCRGMARLRRRQRGPVRGRRRIHGSTASFFDRRSSAAAAS